MRPVTITRHRHPVFGGNGEQPETDPQKAARGDADEEHPRVALAIFFFGCIVLGLDGVWAYHTYDLCMRRRPSGDTITESTKAEYDGAPSVFVCILLSMLSCFTVLFCEFVRLLSRHFPTSKAFINHKRFRFFARLATTALPTTTAIAYAWFLSTYDNLGPIYRAYASYLPPIPHNAAVLSLVVSAYVS